jgi:hypothetical protein
MPYNALLYMTMEKKTPQQIHAMVLKFPNIHSIPRHDMAGSGLIAGILLPAGGGVAELAAGLIDQFPVLQFFSLVKGVKWRALAPTTVLAFP